MSLINNRPSSPVPASSNLLSRKGSCKNTTAQISRNPLNGSKHSEYVTGLEAISKKVQELRNAQIALIFDEKSDFNSFFATTLHDIQKELKNLTPKIADEGSLLRKKKDSKILTKEDLKNLTRSNSLQSLTTILKNTEDLLIEFFQKPHNLIDVAKTELAILEGFQALIGCDSRLNDKIQDWGKDSEAAYKLEKSHLNQFSQLLKLYSIQKRIQGVSAATLSKPWEIKFFNHLDHSKVLENLNHEIAKSLKEELIYDLQEFLLQSSPLLLQAQFKHLKENIGGCHFGTKVLYEFRKTKDEFNQLSLEKGCELVKQIKRVMLFQSHNPWCDLDGVFFDYSPLNFEFVVNERLLHHEAFFLTPLGKEIRFHFLLDDRKKGIEYLNRIIKNPENATVYLERLVKAWVHEMSQDPNYIILQQVIEEVIALEQFGDAKSFSYLNLIASFKNSKTPPLFKRLSHLISQSKKQIPTNPVLKELESYLSLSLNSDPKETKNLESTLKGFKIVKFIEEEIYKLQVAFLPKQVKLEDAGEQQRTETKLTHSPSGNLIKFENFFDIKIVDNKLKITWIEKPNVIDSKTLKRCLILIQLAARYLYRDEKDSQNTLLVLLEKIRNHSQFLHHFDSSDFSSLYADTYQYAHENYQVKPSEKPLFSQFLQTIIEEANPWNAHLMMVAHAFSKKSNNLLRILYDLKKSETGQLNFLRFVLYYLENKKMSFPVAGTPEFSSVEALLDLILKTKYPDQPNYKTLLEQIRNQKNALQSVRSLSRFEDVLQNRPLNHIDYNGSFLKNVFDVVFKVEAEINSKKALLDSLNKQKANLDGTAESIEKTSKLKELAICINQCNDRLKSLDEVLTRYKKTLTDLKKKTLSYVGEIHFQLLKYLYRLDNHIVILDKMLTDEQEKKTLYEEVKKKNLKTLLPLLGDSISFEKLKSLENQGTVDKRILLFLASLLKRETKNHPDCISLKEEGKRKKPDRYKRMDELWKINHQTTDFNLKKYLKKAFSEEVKLKDDQIRALSNKKDFIKLTGDALRSFLKKPCEQIKEKPKSHLINLGPYAAYFIGRLKSEDFYGKSTTKDSGKLKVNNYAKDVEIQKIKDDINEYFKFNQSDLNLKMHMLDHVDAIQDNVLEELLNMFLSEPLDELSLAEFHMFLFNETQVNFQSSPTILEILRRANALRSGFIPYTLIISKDHRKTAEQWLRIAKISWEKKHFELYQTIAFSLDENIKDVDKNNDWLKTFVEEAQKIMIKKNKEIYRIALESKFNGFTPAYPIINITMQDFTKIADQDLFEEKEGVTYIKLGQFEIFAKLKESLMKHLSVHLSAKQSSEKKNDLLNIYNYLSLCCLNFPKDPQGVVRQKYTDTTYYQLADELAKVGRSL